ncbi:MAG TPA: helix-turn-helix transcriptional regulator [Anaerolineales bacterium]|nr:helix-turn-helix transcriptional regulator [Anaerolineales bacterium]
MPETKTQKDPRTISHEDALNLIRSMVKQHGTQTAAARELGITAVYMSDILAGKSAISDNVARKLGYRRVIVFEKAGEHE